ncbi:MAG: sugar transferase [Acidimicrobiia bacterium]
MPTRREDEASPGNLRARLIAADVITLAVTLVVVLGFAAQPPAPLQARPLASVGIALVALAVGVAVAFASRLYRSRVCAVRSVEKLRLARVAVAVGAALAVGGAVTHVALGTVRVVVSAAAVFVALATERLVYHQWLRVARARGRYGRPILLVGANPEARHVLELLHTHPEVGLRVVGVVGDPFVAADLGIDVPWRGELADLDRALDETGVPGVLVVASAMDPDDARRTVRTLTERGVHVQVSTGLAGVDHRRLRALPLSHEPLFYVEPSQPNRLALAAKRTLDFASAGIGLVVVSPLLLAAAIAIKVQDRGPVLFKQERIGRNGVPFSFLKLRTMRPASDAKLGEVAHRNERNGPLFKDVADPRRTKVGHILEAASIDELPQLINVLIGQMSLVGPRPALPHEVAQFDEELLERHRVRPGITGLWQVESRDNPSFAAYRRLDLFYVENWSLSLDAAILLTTFGVVISRAVQRVARRFSRAVPNAALDAATTSAPQPAQS